MRKLLYITPHLSTGGAPQYLLKKIEYLIDTFDIHLVEYSDTGGTEFVVQKNKIFNLISSTKRVTLGENKKELLTFIETVNPDIIHFEEIPEMFMDMDIANQIYRPDREYTIFETSHDSSQSTANKKFFPDKFMFVSNWQIEQYSPLGIPSTLVEYPIEYRESRDRAAACDFLGLEPTKKHIINVGLFTPRKNQAEFFEYARRLPQYEFHCIGNQAGNFKEYWEPLMKEKPANVTVWGERADVDNFYQAADLFLFTSKGTALDKETMPLVLREALSWKLPTFLYNLEVYQGYFDKHPVTYLEDINTNVKNIQRALKEDVNLIKDFDDVFVLSTYPNSKATIDLTKECIESIKKIGRKIILTSHYPVPVEIQDLVDYVIFDSNNLLVKHNYFKYAWWKSPVGKFEINLTEEENDLYHGPAVYTNYYNGAQLAAKLGFSKVYFLNFDYHVKNVEFFNDLSSKLDLYDACLLQDENEEGLTYSTFFMGFRTEFYTKFFPFISTEEDYTEWVNQVKSTTNGLERTMHAALEKNPNTYLISKDVSEQQLDFKNFSQVEYLTVLPSNKPDIIVPTAQFSDSFNTKLLTIYIKDLDGKILRTKVSEIDKKQLIWYEVNSNINNSNFFIEFKVEDTILKKVVKTKSLRIDDNYLTQKLNKNGNVTFKDLSS